MQSCPAVLSFPRYAVRANGALEVSPSMHFVLGANEEATTALALATPDTRPLEAPEAAEAAEAPESGGFFVHHFRGVPYQFRWTDIDGPSKAQALAGADFLAGLGGEPPRYVNASIACAKTEGCVGEECGRGWCCLVQCQAISRHWGRGKARQKAIRSLLLGA